MPRVPFGGNVDGQDISPASVTTDELTNVYDYVVGPNDNLPDILRNKLSSGQSVFIGPGDYLFESPVSRTGLSNVTIAGTGSASRLNADPGISDDILTFVNPVSVVVENLRFFGERGNNSNSPRGVAFDGLSDTEPCRVSNCYFDNHSAAGLYAKGAGKARTLTVENCVFHNSGGTGGAALTSETPYIEVVGCAWDGGGRHFQANKANFTVTGGSMHRANQYCIYIKNASNDGKGVINGVQIAHNNTGSFAVALVENARAVNISQCEFKANAGYYIHLKGGYKCSIENNLIDGESTDDIIRLENDTETCEGNLIQGNRLSPEGLGTNAVNEVSGDYNIVRDNVSYSSTVGFNLTGTNTQNLSSGNEAIDVPNW